MQLTFYEVASVLKAKNDVHQFPDCTFGKAEFDSRLIEEGDLFLPLKGARDGHDFIATAFENGAAATLSEKNWAIILIFQLIMCWQHCSVWHSIIWKK